MIRTYMPVYICTFVCRHLVSLFLTSVSMIQWWCCSEWYNAVRCYVLQSVCVCTYVGSVFVCTVFVYIRAYFSQLQARLTVVEERLAVSKASEAALTAKLAAAEAEVSVHDWYKCVLCLTVNYAHTYICMNVYTHMCTYIQHTYIICTYILT